MIKSFKKLTYFCFGLIVALSVACGAVALLPLAENNFNQTASADVSAVPTLDDFDGVTDSILYNTFATSGVTEAQIFSAFTSTSAQSGNFNVGNNYTSLSAPKIYETLKRIMNSGDGTESNPYEISCVNDFIMVARISYITSTSNFYYFDNDDAKQSMQVSTFVSSHFKVTGNLDFSGYIFNTPIKNFNGTFDGGLVENKSINGLTILDATTTVGGLFYYNGYNSVTNNKLTIKNINLTNVFIYAGNSAVVLKTFSPIVNGSIGNFEISGINTSGYFLNYTTGDKTSGVGGIVARVHSNVGFDENGEVNPQVNTINNCTNGINIVSATCKYVGGIVGTLNSATVRNSVTKLYYLTYYLNITNCVNNGSINDDAVITDPTLIASTTNYIGGLIGNGSGCAITISGSENNGNIGGYSYVGGFVGGVTGSLIINNSEEKISANYGNINFYGNYAGGLVGSCGTMRISGSNGRTIKCYGDVVCKNLTNSSCGRYVGGVVGNCSSTITNALDDGISNNVYSLTVSVVVDNGVDEPETTNKYSNIVKDDIENGSNYIYNEDTYIYNEGLNVWTCEEIVNSGAINTTTTKTIKFVSSSPVGLNMLALNATDANKFYSQLDYVDIAPTEAGESMTIIANGKAVGGAVGEANRLNASNITTNNLTIKVGTVVKDSYMGGIFGSLSNASNNATYYNIENIISNTILDFGTASYLSSSGITAYVGGIAGLANYGYNFNNCINNANISILLGNNTNSCYLGGIVATRAGFGNFTNCTNNGDLYGRVRIGGIVGDLNCNKVADTVMYNCKNEGQITANSYLYVSNSGNAIIGGYVGGLIGNQSASSLEYKVIINACSNSSTIIYATEDPNELVSYFGGFVGFMFYGEINNCHITRQLEDNKQLLDVYGNYVGGFVGYGMDVTINSSDISYCNIRGKNNVGGAVGHCFGTIKTLGTNSVNNCNIVASSHFDDVNSGSYAGGFVGQAYNPRVSGVNVNDCTITAKMSYSGGLFGLCQLNSSYDYNYCQVLGYTFEYGTMYVRNCNSISNAVAVSYTPNSAASGYVGGIAGLAYSVEFDNCTVSNATITSGINYVGGFAGRIDYTSYVSNKTGVNATEPISVTNLYSSIHNSKVLNSQINAYSGSLNVTYVGGLVGYANNFKTISNCTVEVDISSNGNYIGGAMGYVNLGVLIDNVNVNCTIAEVEGNLTDMGARTGIGGLIGYASNMADVTNCSTIGSITACSGYTAGFIGEIRYTNALVNDQNGNARSLVVINNCFSKVNVNYSNSSTLGDKNNVAGFIAYIHSADNAGSPKANVSISNSYANCNITHLASYSGGFIGANYFANSTINNCYFIGSMNMLTGSAVSYIGGFIGSTHYGTVDINECYAKCETVGGASSDYVGGFMGRISEYAYEFCSGTTLTNCYAIVDTISANQYAGLFLGGILFLDYSNSNSGSAGDINVYVTNCYANCAINLASSMSYIGSFSGYYSGAMSPYISNNYFDTRDCAVIIDNYYYVNNSSTAVGSPTFRAVANYAGVNATQDEADDYIYRTIFADYTFMYSEIKPLYDNVTNNVVDGFSSSVWSSLNSGIQVTPYLINLERATTSVYNSGNDTTTLHPTEELNIEDYVGYLYFDGDEYTVVVIAKDNANVITYNGAEYSYDALSGRYLPENANGTYLIRGTSTFEYNYIGNTINIGNYYNDLKNSMFSYTLDNLLLFDGTAEEYESEDAFLLSPSFNYNLTYNTSNIALFTKYVSTSPNTLTVKVVYSDSTYNTTLNVGESISFTGEESESVNNNNGISGLSVLTNKEYYFTAPTTASGSMPFSGWLIRKGDESAIISAANVLYLNDFLYEEMLVDFITTDAGGSYITITPLYEKIYYFIEVTINNATMGETNIINNNMDLVSNNVTAGGLVNVITYRLSVANYEIGDVEQIFVNATPIGKYYSVQGITQKEDNGSAVQIENDAFFAVSPVGSGYRTYITINYMANEYYAVFGLVLPNSSLTSITEAGGYVSAYDINSTDKIVVNSNTYFNGTDNYVTMKSTDIGSYTFMGWYLLNTSGDQYALVTTNPQITNGLTFTSEVLDNCLNEDGSLSFVAIYREIYTLNISVANEFAEYGYLVIYDVTNGVRYSKLVNAVFDSGTVITVEAVANRHYAFDKMVVDGGESEDILSIFTEFTVDSNRTIVANFVKQIYALNVRAIDTINLDIPDNVPIVSTDGVGNGMNLSIGDQIYSASVGNEDGEIADYILTGWYALDNNGDYIAINEYYDGDGVYNILLDADFLNQFLYDNSINIFAIYIKQIYIVVSIPADYMPESNNLAERFTIKKFSSETNGYTEELSLSENGDYVVNYGDQVEIKIASLPYYLSFNRFDGSTDDDNIVAGSLKFESTEDRFIVLQFNLENVVWNNEVEKDGANGELNISKEEAIKLNDVIVLTFDPKAGYELKDWTINGLTVEEFVKSATESGVQVDYSASTNTLTIKVTETWANWLSNNGGKLDSKVSTKISDSFMTILLIGGGFVVILTITLSILILLKLKKKKELADAIALKETQVKRLDTDYFKRLKEE